MLRKEMYERQKNEIEMFIQKQYQSFTTTCRQTCRNGIKQKQMKIKFSTLEWVRRY